MRLAKRFTLHVFVVNHCSLVPVYIDQHTVNEHQQRSFLERESPRSRSTDSLLDVIQRQIRSLTCIDQSKQYLFFNEDKLEWPGTLRAAVLSSTKILPVFCFVNSTAQCKVPTEQRTFPKLATIPRITSADNSKRFPQIVSRGLWNQSQMKHMHPLRRLLMSSFRILGNKTKNSLLEVNKHLGEAAIIQSFFSSFSKELAETLSQLKICGTKVDLDYQDKQACWLNKSIKIEKDNFKTLNRMKERFEAEAQLNPFFYLDQNQLVHCCEDAVCMSSVRLFVAQAKSMDIGAGFTPGRTHNWTRQEARIHHMNRDSLIQQDGKIRVHLEKQCFKNVAVLHSKFGRLFSEPTIGCVLLEREIK